MKYLIRKTFAAKTSQGGIELQPGQIVSLPTEKALPLVSEGKISPAERVAYKIYSDILEACLWVIASHEYMETLRTSQNVTEAIYTADDIRKLKGMDKEGLKAVHRVKEVFPMATVEETTAEGL